MTATRYLAELSCRAVGGTDASFKRAVKKVVVELDKLEDGRGVLFISNGADRTVTFSVSGEDALTAVTRLSNVARTAFHAAGESTRGWPSFETLELNAELIREKELVSA